MDKLQDPDFLVEWLNFKYETEITGYLAERQEEKNRHTTQIIFSFEPYTQNT